MTKYIILFAIVSPLFFMQGKEVYVREKDPCTVSAQKCIQEYFGSQAQIAIAIAYAESNLDPKAENYNCKYGKHYKSCKPEDVKRAVSKDVGLMQINDVHAGSRDLMDMETNVKVAREVYDRQGWEAWVTFRNNKFLDYLDQSL